MKTRFRTFVTLILVLALLCACGQKAGATWQEQYDLGIKYLDEGNYEEAILAFTAAIELDAKRPEGYIGRGDAYALSGDTEDNLSAARADYETALGLDETLPQAWLGLADVYIRQGDYDKALQVLKEALEKTGSDPAISDKLAELESGSFTDSSGNVRRTNGYDGSGTLIWYHIFDYDAQGQQSAVTSYNAAGTQTGRVDLKYDSQGRILVNYFYYSTGEVGIMEYERDSQGNVTSTKQHFKDGISEIRFTYDQSGNTIREDRYEPDGTLSSSLQCEYDGEGNRVKESEYGPDGQLKSILSSTYNAQGKRQNATCYDAQNQLLWRTEYRYDDQGNYLGYDHYDSQGNLMSSTVVQP